MLHVDDALILEAVVLRVDVTAMFLGRHAVAFIVHELREAVLEGAAEGDVAQVVLCDFVLRLDPFSGLGGGVVFEPTVRVGDLCAEVVVNDGGVFSRLRVGLDGIALLLLVAAEKGDDTAHNQ